MSARIFIRSPSIHAAVPLPSLRRARAAQRYRAALPREAALGEERRDFRLAAAEGAVEGHRVLGVAGAVDRLEPRGERGVERVTRLGEGGEPVGVEHLGPEIGVIARGVAAPGKEVLEMRRTVAQADLRRHADFSEEFLLEPDD